MSDNRPAILILTKRGENTRYMFFESHIDAFDTAVAFASMGWRWEMVSPEMYTRGQRPEKVNLIQQRLFKEAGA